jgi:hypothetical protein
MAGSWASFNVTKGNFADENFREIEGEATGDAVDGSFPNWTITETEAVLSGMLLGVRVLFDGSDTPAAIDLQITDANGIDLLGGAATGDNKFTDSGKVSLSPPEPFHTSLTAAIATEAANANAGDKCKVFIYVLL